MANPDPSKTEKPTAKRLSEERDKGNVPVSKDTSSVCVLMALTLFLYLAIPWYNEAFIAIFRLCFAGDCRGTWDLGNIEDGLMSGLTIFALSGITTTLLLVGVSIISIRVQVGSFFSLKPLEWKFDSLNPASGAKELLPNSKNIMRFVLTFSKVSVVSLVSYFLIKAEFDKLMDLASMPTAAAVSMMMQITGKLVLTILAIFIIIAIIDILWKQHKHTDNLMMTKDEIKDEVKNSEGDPKVKARIRAKMREMLAQNVVQNVKDATVVVTNPTHVAVCLRYEHGDAAPKVLCKGLRKRALLIKKIARENGIPTVEAPPLARSLYRSTEAGAFIDNEFFKAVATILARLYKSRKLKSAMR